SAIGAVIAMAGVFLTRLRRSDASGMTAINRAFFVSAGLGAVLVAVAAWFYLPGTWEALRGEGWREALGVPADGSNDPVSPQLLAIGAVVIGVVLAAVIQALTGYFTATNRRPVRDIGKTSLTGPATVVLAGVSVGFESAVYSALVIGAAVFGA